MRRCGCYRERCQISTVREEIRFSAEESARRATRDLPTSGDLQCPKSSSLAITQRSQNGAKRRGDALASSVSSALPPSFPSTARNRVHFHYVPRNPRVNFL